MNVLHSYHYIYAMCVQYPLNYSRFNIFQYFIRLEWGNISYTFSLSHFISHFSSSQHRSQTSLHHHHHPPALCCSRAWRIGTWPQSRSSGLPALTCVLGGECHQALRWCHRNQGQQTSEIAPCPPPVLCLEGEIQVRPSMFQESKVK